MFSTIIYQPADDAHICQYCQEPFPSKCSLSQHIRDPHTAEASRDRASGLLPPPRDHHRHHQQQTMTSSTCHHQRGSLCQHTTVRSYERRTGQPAPCPPPTPGPHWPLLGSPAAHADALSHQPHSLTRTRSPPARGHCQRGREGLLICHCPSHRRLHHIPRVPASSSDQLCLPPNHC